MPMHGLHWLPAQSDWSAALKSIDATDAASWERLQALANARLDFLSTNSLDRALGRLIGRQPPDRLATKPVRLAVLSTSTMDHLLPGLRVGALRWGLHLSINVGNYGQYLQDLNDPNSSFYSFKPTVALLAFDAASMLGEPDAVRTKAAALDAVEATIEKLRQIWRLAAQGCSGQVIQQTFIPHHPSLIGSNEHRLVGSLRSMVDTLNYRLREAADAEGVDILALDHRIAEGGIDAWYNPVLWHQAKQEISPTAAPLYGDLLARLLAAQQGRARKCVALDLDNTLWGGVIGDDGLEGIVLGQGSALGEAYVAFQRYLRGLSRRGVILAVCSKNDEVNALATFEKHPDMILRRTDIACFVANWRDKPANLRSIAETLSIGIDSLVFVDDNPFERTLVRRELPMVAVPELPEDPALYGRCIADAGYFEALRITDDDLERSQQYQGNIQRELLRSSSTDVSSYLRSLGMKLTWQPFDTIGLQRIVQLINKTNQFNLTTRRYTQSDVTTFMGDPRSLTLQLRLVDAFGDNGVIAIVIARPADAAAADLLIDTWLMSCRVLGRQVEEATMNILAAEAADLGAANLIGEYRPTGKNSLVREHYAKLGFSPVSVAPGDNTLWSLPLKSFTPFDTCMEIKEGKT